MGIDEDYNKKVNRTIALHLSGVLGWIFALLFILQIINLSTETKFGINVILPLVMLFVIFFRFIFIHIEDDKFYNMFIIYSLIGIILGIASVVYFIVNAAFF